ncbi:glycosyltransferase [Oceanobacillus saliphilus]|uniref:glycosyltransferase n=1 Tax=Oceanobacillus saliphilus TaxID=2925834 RepID=UPI00201D8EF7|nr:glycosyltransferase [Oceanobacillus saliphilus]
MKQKIIFMVINMNIGGTEKALLNMIAEMPKEKYEITILMLEKYGGFLESIPSEVNVEYVEEYSRIKDMVNNPPKEIAISLLKKGKLIKGFNFTIITLVSRVLKSKRLLFKYILKNVPEFKAEYDIAVAYAGPMDFISYFVVHKIKAEKKIQWIHFDVTKIGFDRQFASKLYHKFDKLFVVSEEGKDKLIDKLPDLEKRIDSFPNRISTQLVLEMANKGRGFEDHFTGFRILTVGRLSKEKGQDLIIPVLAKLKENGVNVRWYCIGEGSAREEYEQLIKKHGVEKEFILLGAYPNPYPFMKQCDIYVQPSRHEGYCITLAEARCFNNPIVSTNFTGANEQLSNNKKGIIINFDEQQMILAILQILKNDQFQMKLINETQIGKVSIRNKKILS